MSQLQGIAARLRALAQDATPLSANVEASARQLKSLSRQVESLERSGVNVGALLGAIQSAQGQAENAASAARQVKAEGVAWADHLAKGGSGGGSGGSAHGSSGGPADSRGRLQDLDLSAVDFSDNPITDDGRGGATMDDYRWAAATWDTKVRPGLESGMTRDDFAAIDAANGYPPLRRLADVHDMFLGSDPIHVSGGEVIGGRHRIQAARDVGITHLPARIL